MTGAASTAPAMPEGEDLWRAVIALYAEPGAAGICLAAQDEAGADVLLLLAAVLLARHGRCLDAAGAALLDGLAAPWREEVLQPIRALRRRLRRTAGAEAVAAGLQQLELDAERRQLMRLAPPLATMPVAAAPALRDNLRAVLARLPGGGAEEHLEALASVFGGGDTRRRDSTIAGE